jgi:NADPH:quinone reductase-like Zn-dependent oxidoreductase
LARNEVSVKAIVLTRYGPPPEVLQLQEIDKPKPKDNEVLVSVRATAVNDWDWGLVRGKPYIYRLLFGLLKPKVAVLGAEVAGTVEVVGSGARKFKPGDCVYGDLSEAGFGGFAEFVCTREDALALKPSGMTFEQAASLPHAAMLAFQGLVDVGQLRHGERVLINGAGGGVGTIGVQIAKQYEAEVTGVDSELKLDALRNAGFDHVIDYRQQDFTRNGQRYDLIVDAKTTRSPFSFLRSLNPGGRYVTVGGHTLRLLQTFCTAPLISRVSGKQVRIVALKPNRDLEYINDLFESKGLQFVIDGPYPLSDVPQAVQRFGEAKHVGKVVISVVPGSEPYRAASSVISTTSESTHHL